MELFKINERGAGLALAFFGGSGFLHGVLVFRSTFLPCALGILGMIASAGWLRFLFPSLRTPRSWAVPTTCHQKPAERRSGR